MNLWDEEATNASTEISKYKKYSKKKFEVDSYIYKYDSGVYLSFIELEKSLNDQKNANGKYNYLNNLKDKKNRFVSEDKKSFSLFGKSNKGRLLNDFFCLLIIAIVIKGAKLSGLNQFNTEYLSIENCNNIKGVFLLIIIVNHASQYLNLSTDNFYDNGWLVFIKFLGQMVVSMFMFYSGYGIMESIAKKKRKYILSMPYKRVFKTFINFDIALVFT